jgi:tRNA threonylcarbamoyladenosine biosynthesis protein TsaB
MNKEPSIILCIETSGKLCSVALFNGDVQIGYQSHLEPNAHARVLFNLIDACLTEAGVSMSQLNAVAVSKGPGSYTGLRIGVAAAKGLCHAMNIPLMAISTLELMAAMMTQKDSLKVPMLDARRNEVYTAVYDANGNCLEEPFPLILEEWSYEKYLASGKVVFAGDGSDKWEKQCNHPNASFMRDLFPDAANMGTLAFRRFSKAQFEDVAYFEPDYVKPVFVVGG